MHIYSGSRSGVAEVVIILIISKIIIEIIVVVAEEVVGVVIQLSSYIIVILVNHHPLPFCRFVYIYIHIFRYISIYPPPHSHILWEWGDQSTFSLLKYTVHK